MYKVEPKAKITSSFFKEAKDIHLKSTKMDNEIVDRIHYIMVSIFNLFNKKNAYWYFYGAEEGEQGDLWSHCDGRTIDIVIESCSGRDDMIIILNDGSEWGFEDSIPTRWLFEDFEEELVSGKKKYEEKEKELKAKEKELLLIQKQEEKDLIKAVKKKLTKKELAVLKKAL